MPSSLDNLVRAGKLKIEAPARSEIDGLVRSGAVRLKDASTAGLSLAKASSTSTSGSSTR